MPIYIDMLNHPVEISEVPNRIVCLVPSISLLLYDMGLGDRLVGVTKFCVHPKDLQAHRRIVGGTKLLRMDVIHIIKTDLIIANKEENNKLDIESLREHYPVWVSDVSTLSQSYDMIRQLGLITNTESAATSLIRSIQDEKERFNNRFAKTTLRVAYLIWKQPLMAVGGDTFIHEMLLEAGFNNALADYTRYPSFTEDGLAAHKVDWIFLSSEPYPFQEKHKQALSSVVPIERILLVDGESFSWYGSFLKNSFRYFSTLRKKILPL